MDDLVLQKMLGMADAHFRDDECRELLRICILDKAGEHSVWSGLTLNVHYMPVGGVPADLAI
ncbi:hypothetical protein GE107_20410 [Cohnella sp. CFH 77786]|uniref:hypothetical protein n=1 Tax=Cohnella sp. CFH 77786 TaxID=2662265 RepID=UPI001C608BED|nr:hypothetical protein [Cohnella sp. CFH 77786]MBW5448411.1 hypothetical protein [Cohnella sp. CFH 77786]